MEIEKHPTMSNAFKGLRLGSFRKVDLGIIWDGAPTPPEIPEQSVTGSSGGGGTEVNKAWNWCSLSQTVAE